MPYGGYAPGRERYGGAVPTLKTICDGLADGLGDAYDTTSTSNVFPQLMATARAIQALYDVNDLIANQWDPVRMSPDLGLPRWEAFLGVLPSRGDALATRKARVAAKMAAATGPTNGNLNDICSSILGSAFVGIEYTPLSLANMPPEAEWPDAAVPHAFYSTVAHVLVRVTPPTNLSAAQFYALMSACAAALYDVLPAWTSVDFGEYSSAGVNGFLLDEPDLNLETFSS